MPKAKASLVELPAEAGVLLLEGQEIPYITRRSAQRRRSYGFVVDGEGKVVFTAPKWVKHLDLLDFARRRRRFIFKRLEELEVKRRKGVEKAAQVDDLKGKYCELPVAWWREVARRILTARVDFWAREMGLTYGNIRITSGRTVWGSCSSRGNISLSWRLLHVSRDLAEYVVVHELCHRVHMNHGVRFWALVGKYVPDYVEKRRALNRAHGEIG